MDIPRNPAGSRLPQGVTFTTIGRRVTGTAIIQNELCAERLVWNKVRMIKDPDTGKRMSRPNAKNEWQTTDVPDLRIVFQKLFDATQRRKQARGNSHPNHQRRPAPHAVGSPSLRGTHLRCVRVRSIG